jgi:hypothetical protein
MGRDRYGKRLEGMKRHLNTQRRLGGARPIASLTPTLSEDNFALQRTLARRELLEREKRAKQARQRARREAVLGPVTRVEVAVKGKAGRAAIRGRERVAGVWQRMVDRAKGRGRGVKERRA